MRRAFLLVLVSLVAWPAQATGAPDDCGSGVDAPGEPLTGLPIALPMDCDGALLGAADTWDVYAVTFSEGPVYALLEHGTSADFDLCLVNADWTDGACPDDTGPESIEMWWPAGPAFIAIISDRGEGSYHVSVRQQDDCGTGVDALWDDPPTLATPLIRCEATLDTFVGDSEDAFLVPPPAIPDVALLRIEPYTWHVALCVDDVVDHLGIPHRRCTGSTYSRLLVARDPVRPLRVTIEGFNVQPFPYRLIVEDPVQNPPPVPPIL